MKKAILPVHWDVNSGGEAEAFRTAMRRIVGGVTVITTLHDREPWGMTVSAFTPVCIDPPTLLVCVNNRTTTASDISRGGRFAVNLLSQAQLYLPLRRYWHRNLCRRCCMESAAVCTVLQSENQLRDERSRHEITLNRRRALWRLQPS